MANEAVYYGTGRRKNAVARVRLVPGTGKVTVNGREAMNYFGREALVNYATMPFKVTDTQDHFDVIALCDGGGISGQAGALRLGIARALLEAGDYRPVLKKETWKEAMEKHPERIVERAVKGMLPHSSLGRKQFTKLKVYAGPEHPHQAQNPRKISVEA